MEYQIPKGHSLTAASLFHDRLGLLQPYRHALRPDGAGVQRVAPANGDAAATSPQANGGAARPTAQPDAIETDDVYDFIFGDDDDADAVPPTPGSTTPLAARAGSAPGVQDDAVYASPLDASEAVAGGLPATAAAAAATGEDLDHVYCLAATDGGQLRIFQLPDMEEVFCCPVFGGAAPLLSDSPQRLADADQTCQMQGTAQATGDDADPKKSRAKKPSRDNADASFDVPVASADLADQLGVIEELMVVALGRPGTRLHLVARTRRSHVLIYEIFLSAPPASTAATFEGRIPVRLRKVQHRLARLQGERDLNSQTRRFRAFERVGGASGVFICGPRPMWVAAGHQRRGLRVHTMPQDKSVRCFAPFQHITCPDGFIYFTADKGLMRTAVVPADENLGDVVLAARKRRLPHTARMIEFDPESGVYILVTQEKRPARRLVRLSNTAAPASGPDFRWRPGEVPAMADVFRLQLFSSQDWDIVPDSTEVFEDDHHISAMRVVRLETQQHESGVKTFVAVGTTALFGESVTSEGDVLVYEVLTVEPEPGKPTAKNKLKMLTRYVQKGAVTAIDSVQQHLLVCVGQETGAKVYIHHFRDCERLEPVAFYEAKIFTSSVRVIQSLILLGDYAQGMQVLRLTDQKLHDHQSVRWGRGEGGGSGEEQRRLSLQVVRAHLQSPPFSALIDPRPLSVTPLALQIMKKTHKRKVFTLARVTRDLIPSDVYNVEMLVKGSEVRFVSFDRAGNVVIGHYDNIMPGAEGGRLMQRRSEFHLGKHCVASFRMQCAPHADAPGGPVKPSEWQFVKYFTLEGSQGYIAPIAEMSFRRLQMLEDRLEAVLPPLAGLNHKAERCGTGGARRL